MIYNQNISLDLNTRSPNLIIGAKQHDNKSRSITATILENGNVVNIPSNAEVSYRIQKPNGICEWNQAELLRNENKIRILLSGSDLSQAGRNIVDILITVGTFSLGTTNFILDVQGAPSISGMQEDTESIGYLEQIVNQAHDVIEDAQAWAEGKRGDSDIVTDFAEWGYPDDHLNVGLSFATFKENIIPNDSGTVVDYVFQYSDEGWVYVSYTRDSQDISVNTVVNMTLLGFTISEVPGSATPLSVGDIITVHASFADEAYNNNAKYYAEVASTAASNIDNTLSSLTSDINSKLDIPIASSVAPSNPKLGDFWIDTSAQFQLSGRIVSGDNIQIGAITSSLIATRTITSNKIVTGAIENILLSSVPGEEAVTNSVIRNHTIEGVKIASGAITDYHLAENAVSPYALAPSAVLGANISEGVIERSHLTTGIISSDELDSNSVTTSALSSFCVTTDKLANNVITKDKLDPNFITVGTIPGHSNGDNESTFGVLTINSQAAGTALVFINSNDARGLVSFVCTNAGTTTNSSIIGYAASSSGVTKETNLTLINGINSLQIRNDGMSIASYVIITTSGNLSFQVTPA